MSFAATNARWAWCKRRRLLGVLTVCEWQLTLLDGAALRDVLTRRGAELVLHGHGHFSAGTYLDAAHRRNLAIGVPSASAIGRNVERCATYHVYRIQRCETGWRLLVSVRTYLLDHRRFVAEGGRRLRLALAASTT